MKNKNIIGLITAMGWLLFITIYLGAIWAVVMYIEMNGLFTAAGHLSAIVQIGAGLLAFGVFVLYTIIMLFIQVLFETAWLAVTRKLSNLRGELDKKKQTEEMK